MTSKIIFGYWAQRARGMPIRFLLEYVEANYEQKTYRFENSAEWFEKDKLTFKPFPNLPYVKDGDFYLTETDVVLKYIARRHPKYHELLGIGKGENDEFKIDQLINHINDVRASIREFYANPEFHKKKRDVLEQHTKRLNKFVQYKGENKFLLPYLSLADFKFVEMLLYYKALDNDLFIKNLPSLNQHITDFYSLPRIRDYVKTDRYRSHEEFFPSHTSTYTGKDFVSEFNKQFIN